jgi:hypothetical protein
MNSNQPRCLSFSGVPTDEAKLPRNKMKPGERGGEEKDRHRGVFISCFLNVYVIII